MIDSNSPISLLVRLLDVASLRNKVIAQNVANVNTPGHQRLEVHFEEALARSLNAGDHHGATRLSAQVRPGAGGAERTDGNNVDIDQEMGRLQKNHILFQLYTQVLATQLAQYRSAIQGR